jgi:hypothetical protein
MCDRVGSEGGDRQAPNFRAKTTVRVAGIDDWSWRMGRTYGTIIVDLERRVVDVLQDRTTAGTAEWLGQHPSEMVAAFDRCDRVAPVTMFRAIRQQMDELGCEPDYRISSLTKLADSLEGDRQSTRS